MSSPTRIVEVDPRTDDRWLQLASSPAGSAFTSPPWIRALSTTYGFEPRARVAVDGSGAPTAGFAWVPVHDIRGSRLISLPFSDRAEPLCDDAGVFADLAREALDSEHPLTLRCFDDAPVGAVPQLDRVGEAAWHGTPLTAPLEEIAAGFAYQTRRNIRIAERRGVKVVASTELAAVHHFHRLHVALRKRKYRLLAQSADFFERVWREFRAADAVVTILAYHDDDVIAGAVYLVWNNTLYYKFSASVGEHLVHRPNEAIQWAAIEWAVERGLTLLDWGLTDLDQPGLLEYKRKWGCEERRIATWRSGEPRPVPGVGPLLGGLTELLTDDAVPDEVAARAGALLYRYFC
jgi:CelD/BcsL family acetyltransferase involved in cellulose biosynthesis